MPLKDNINTYTDRPQWGFVNTKRKDTTKTALPREAFVKSFVGANHIQGICFSGIFLQAVMFCGKTLGQGLSLASDLLCNQGRPWASGLPASFSPVQWLSCFRQSGDQTQDLAHVRPALYQLFYIPNPTSYCTLKHF